MGWGVYTDDDDGGLSGTMGTAGTARRGVTILRYYDITILRCYGGRVCVYVCVCGCVCICVYAQLNNGVLPPTGGWRGR